MPDVCIYEPVPVAEVMPSKTAVETLAFRLLPTLIGKYESSVLSRNEVVRIAFTWAEAFLKICKERSE